MKSKQLAISGILEQKLSKLHYAPKNLYARGALDINDLLQRPIVGIVGTRLPTPYGAGVVNDLVEQLVRRGVVIVSGLALGTDGLSHQACIRAGGQTIAVLPSGIETIYPRTHNPLGQLIEEKGLLISEYPGDGLPRKDQFIARNRIIAALSDVLVIPEAAERSGSLHTANFSLEIGIPVMAVPGNITSRFSGGTNKLIAQGATPVLGVGDIFHQLKIDTEEAADYVPESEAEHQLLEAMSSGLQDGSAIRNTSGLTAQDFMQTLSMLEIKGVIRALGGDQWRKV
ncbi:MAG: DNA-processing protein DprA [bacterium]|nr:DNA-processing protein DprA [bacterium]